MGFLLFLLLNNVTLVASVAAQHKVGLRSKSTKATADVDADRADFAAAWQAAEIEDEEAEATALLEIQLRDDNGGDDDKNAANDSEKENKEKDGEETEGKKDDDAD